MHPFGEGEAQHAWAKLSGTSDILIGIARRDAIERYAELFSEAGVKVASISFSAAVLYSGLRLFGSAPGGGVLAFAGDEGELYGESEAHPVFSAAVEAPLERAVPLAAAELRLPPGSEAKPFESILPAPVRTPEEYDLSRAALPYAAALAGACPRLALAANLLPPELRHTSSRAMFVPTAALAAVLAILLISLAVQAHMQERHRVEVIQAETRKVEPLAEKVAAADKSIGEMGARIGLLDGFRRRSAADLDAVKDVTELLQPPAWLTSLELNADTLNIAGNVEQAAPLLKIIDNSPRFRNSEFTIPIARGGKMEVFRIRAAREEGAR
ncbi:MAG: PilN domain-containing protein [Bryobacteraceae bacterium]